MLMRLERKHEMKSNKCAYCGTLLVGKGWCPKCENYGNTYDKDEMEEV